MIVLILALLGLCLGSFVNALVWRLRQQELTSKKSKVESRKSKESAIHPSRYSILWGRSMCPECKHELAAKDLVPVLSWLSLGGKCRYCQKPINWQYPLVELSTAALFVFSYVFWPDGFSGAGLLQFVLWLVFLTGFMALVVYDLRWFLLPNRIVYPLIGLALTQLLVVSIFYHGGAQALMGGVWGVLIASGIFYVLFQVSKGKWIGGGDVKLGAVLGLLVGGPLMSWMLLFLASCAGTLIAVPLMITGKAQRHMHVPFGPLLILAVIIVRLFGASLLRWARLHYLI